MTPLTQKELGARIRALRYSTGLSLTGVAEKSGIPKVVLSSYERADRRPSVDKAAEWLQAFGHQLAVLGPDERVVSTSTDGEEWVSYVVVYGPNMDGTIECDTEAEARALAQFINWSRVGHRVNRRGTIVFGGES